MKNRKLHIAISAFFFSLMILFVGVAIQHFATIDDKTDLGEASKVTQHVVVELPQDCEMHESATHTQDGIILLKCK